MAKCETINFFPQCGSGVQDHPHHLPQVYLQQAVHPVPLQHNTDYENGAKVSVKVKRFSSCFLVFDEPLSYILLNNASMTHGLVIQRSKMHQVRPSPYQA